MSVICTNASGPITHHLHKTPPIACVNYGNHGCSHHDSTCSFAMAEAAGDDEEVSAGSCDTRAYYFTHTPIIENH